jgi:hypothetical protein
MPDVYTWIAWAIAALALILGAQILGVSGLFLALVVAIVLLTFVGFASSRRAARHMARRDPRFQPTDEVFRDPASGVLTRVYVDATTGERRYWKD